MSSSCENKIKGRQNKMKTMKSLELITGNYSIKIELITKDLARK
jgi:hypothetical protein